MPSHHLPASSPISPRDSSFSLSLLPNYHLLFYHPPTSPSPSVSSQGEEEKEEKDEDETEERENGYIAGEEEKKPPAG
uniref:Uncharacterized protein n=1 Tax=Nelumbo nucifera TaxID=4432 RepID=A0A822YFV5_NELNU|nr:TPA_asm: hypothetical protein HUJ06_009904 [Nelumbo nucifera]